MQQEFLDRAATSATPAQTKTEYCVFCPDFSESLFLCLINLLKINPSLCFVHISIVPQSNLTSTSRKIPVLTGGTNVSSLLEGQRVLIGLGILLWSPLWCFSLQASLQSLPWIWISSTSELAGPHPSGDGRHCAPPQVLLTSAQPPTALAGAPAAPPAARLWASNQAPSQERLWQPG